MKLACQYAIVRFLPYIETGEFANVGVVLFCPEKRFFDFRLLKKGRTRITNFFDKLNPEIFIQGKALFEKELKRTKHLFDKTEFIKHDALMMFDELVRAREALFRFDEKRILLTDDPVNALNDLFNRYVEHGFATKQYQEELLRRNVQQLLKAEKLEKLFTQSTIGPDDFKVPFPFVHKDHARAVIKPLFLAQKDATAVYEHGDTWIKRLERLKKKNALPNRVLFAIETPTVGDNLAVMTACDDITLELKQLDVFVVKTEETAAVLNFAKQ